MNGIETIKGLIEESAASILDSKTLADQISRAIETINNCFTNGNKIIIFGNGGSAADSQHFAAELIGRYKIERESLPAIALTTDSSILTALGNDYGFEYVFSRQCESLVNKNDVAIAISTSGKSPNIINGIKTAKKKGAIIIGLSGGDGGNVKTMSDIPIIVNSKSTPRIQESHRTIIHIICEIVEQMSKEHRTN